MLGARRFPARAAVRLPHGAPLEPRDAARVHRGAVRVPAADGVAARLAAGIARPPRRARRRARRSRRGRGDRTHARFQDLITRYAWGDIWSRPGLDLRTRRLLVLAITAATGRWEEFRLHVRTGLAHELEWCDLEEVLLQTAVYAGVPAANTGLALAVGGARPAAE